MTDSSLSKTPALHGTPIRARMNDPRFPGKVRLTFEFDANETDRLEWAWGDTYAISKVAASPETPKP